MASLEFVLQHTRLGRGLGRVLQLLKTRSPENPPVRSEPSAPNHTSAVAGRLTSNHTFVDQMKRQNCDLLEQFCVHNVIKLGNFTLKSGVQSPIYVDLRPLISVPKILRLTAESLITQVQSSNVVFDYIVGVPYAALSLATIVADGMNMPMLMKRKEAKTYGTKKLVEGVYESGKMCLIIDDVATSGSSILETAESLRQEGLIVSESIVVLDREQGGKELLRSHGINLQSLESMDSILSYLVKKGKMDEENILEIKNMLYNHTKLTENDNDMWLWKSRLNAAEGKASIDLMNLVARKKSNISVAADFTKTTEILKLANEIGSEICMLKLHVDIIDDYSNDFLIELREIAAKEDFMLLEDRKFADIGNTVKYQACCGLHSIASYFDYVTSHSVSGTSVLQGLNMAMMAHAKVFRGCFLIAEMSSTRSLTNLPGYVRETARLASEYPHLVSGFICQKRCHDDPAFLYLTPGVHVERTRDGLGQEWRQPRTAILDDNNDIVIIGRGVTESGNRRQAAATYRQQAWTALCLRDHTVQYIF